MVGTGRKKVQYIEGKEESKVTQQKQAFVSESESIHASKTMTGKRGEAGRERVGREGGTASKEHRRWEGR